MKIKISILLVTLILGTNITIGQQNEDCTINLSLFSDFAKNKRYEEAYKPWKAVLEKCPKAHYAIYGYGESILKHKIKKATTPSEKKSFINKLFQVWEQGAKLYPEKYKKKGELLAKKAQLMYNNKEELGYSDLEIYNAFDKAFTTDLKTFKNPKGLYTYFSLMVDLFDAKQKTPQELFDKYDDVNDKIESEIKYCSVELNKLITKADKEIKLTDKELKYKDYYESYLKNYHKIAKSIDGKLGQRSNCEYLIPIYQKEFENNKNNGQWLQRAMNKMYAKDCTDDPLFVKLVEQKHSLEPNAKTALYLGVLKDKAGKSKEALDHYEQSISLEEDDFQKSKLYSMIASRFKKKGQYAKARAYYRNALKHNPANGNPHLAIAAMYNASANKCGTSNFNKRAVYWLAANEALKAGRVDPTLKSNAAQTANSYRAKAPTRPEIFNEGNAGEVIKIGCWINGSVTVPKL